MSYSENKFTTFIINYLCLGRDGFHLLLLAIAASIVTDGNAATTNISTFATLIPYCFTFNSNKV